MRVEESWNAFSSLSFLLLMICLIFRLVSDIKQFATLDKTEAAKVPFYFPITAIKAGYRPVKTLGGAWDNFQSILRRTQPSLLGRFKKNAMRLGLFLIPLYRQGNWKTEVKLPNITQQTQPVFEPQHLKAILFLTTTPHCFSIIRELHGKW